MNSSRQGSTTSIGSSSATIGSVMPVRALISGGVGNPGVTRVGKVPRPPPPRILTPPTSVMRSLAGDPPVVSRSSTTNSTSTSGVPRSSGRPGMGAGGEGIPAVPFVRAGLSPPDARRTRVRGQAPKGVGRGSAAPDPDDRAEAGGQEPGGGDRGQPLGRGHGQRGGGGQAGQEQRGGGGPDQ